MLRTYSIFVYLFLYGPIAVIVVSDSIPPTVAAT